MSTPVFHDSLPYIDPPPSAAQLAAASALIATELPPTTPTHPSLPPLATSLPSHPPTPLAAIDLAPYSNTTPTPTALATQHAYLGARLANLALLGTFGRNAWVLHGAQLEDTLRALEKELQAAEEEVVRLEGERARSQGLVRAEIEGLEDAWKQGVAQLLSVQVAAEGVRREVLERRRAGGRAA